MNFLILYHHSINSSDVELALVFDSWMMKMQLLLFRDGRAIDENKFSPKIWMK